MGTAEAGRPQVIPVDQHHMRRRSELEEITGLANSAGLPTRKSSVTLQACADMPETKIFALPSLG
jgi:hypothetical protein